MARHAQNTQNNMFAISLQYLKKEMSVEVDFLHADKYESLLQIDSILKLFKVTSLQYLCSISKKEGRNGGHFWHADKHQIFYKL